MEENAKQDNISLDDAKVTCPCCGKPTLDKPLKINNTLLDHFLSCLITHTQFHHTYELFGGKVKVTCTQLDDKDQQLTKEVATALQEMTLVDNIIDEQKCIAIANTIYLMMHISMIQIEGPENTLPAVYHPQAIAKSVAQDCINAIGEYKKNKENNDIASTIFGNYDKLIEPSLVSSIPVNMLVHVQETHAKVYDLLVDSGFDGNFWEGIELA